MRRCRVEWRHICIDPKLPIIICAMTGEKQSTECKGYKMGKFWKIRTVRTHTFQASKSPVLSTTPFVYTSNDYINYINSSNRTIPIVHPFPLSRPFGPSSRASIAGSTEEVDNTPSGRTRKPGFPPPQPKSHLLWCMLVCKKLFAREMGDGREMFFAWER